MKNISDANERVSRPNARRVITVALSRTIETRELHKLAVGYSVVFVEAHKVGRELVWRSTGAQAGDW